MENRRCSPQISSKCTSPTLPFVFIFIILCSQYNTTVVQCQEGNVTTGDLSTQPSSPTGRTKSLPALKRILVSIISGLLTGLTGVVLVACGVRFAVVYMKQTLILKGPVTFSPKITPTMLQLALASENELLGSSSNGKYYKTYLDNGLTIAVKRLEPFEDGSPEMQRTSVKRRIQNELERLAKLRHRNLMSLQAYIRDTPSRFSLVYDYVPTGSLEDAMDRVRENQLQLGWEFRLRIAVGIVKGLQHLHFECIPQILHHNLKPTNVMLDGEFEPRLADGGLAKLMPNLNRANSCYSAPECFQNCRYTEKSDIFSFGMILAVLLTGKDPSDPFFGEAATRGSLSCWLRYLQQVEDAREALDKSITGEEGEEDEMLMAVRVAVVCLSDMPADRPSSDELVLMLSQLHSF